MRKRYITLRVLVNGKVLSEQRAKRIILCDETGEYVRYYGKRPVIWKGSTPTVEVHRPPAGPTAVGGSSHPD